jgi:arylsulfatase A-like enzyme
VPAALQWLEGVAHEPFFLFVQGYDCHLPYSVPLGYSELYDPDYEGVVHRPGFLSVDMLESLDGLAYDPLLPAAFRTFPSQQTMGWPSRSRLLVPGVGDESPAEVVRQFAPPEPGTPALSPVTSAASQTPTTAATRQTFPARLPHWRRLLSPADVAHLVAHYDGAVTYADAWLGIFVESLRQRGLLENTLLVVAGDHGEELGERGRFGHGRLHLEQLRVPLVVVGPGVEPARRVTDVVGLIDLAPTVLELCGTPAFHGHQGKSLGPYLQPVSAAPCDPSRAAYCTSVQGVSVRSGRWHLIRRNGPPDGGAETWSLHDVVQDPTERTDLSAAHPDVAATLRSRLLDWMEQVRPPTLVSPSNLEPGAREGLRRSGYW